MTNPIPQKGRLKEIIIGGIVLIFITLILLIYYNYSLSKRLAELESKLSIPIPPKKEVAKITLPTVLYNLAGTIKNFEGKAILLEATIPQINEGGQLVYATEMRKVITISATKFSRLTFVSKEGENKKTPVETTITFGDFKIGDYIEVISNQDISQKQEFEATQIRIFPR